MKYCYKCQNIWEGKRQPAFRDVCSKCYEELHICLNCRFYDEFKPSKCQLDRIDPVRDKEKANFCEEFQFIDRPLPGTIEDKTDDARNKWENLFKK